MRGASDQESHTSGSTRPPSMEGTSPRTPPPPSHPADASVTSPLYGITETSIRGGASPDMRSVDEDTLTLQAALHQLRTAPPQPFTTGTPDRRTVGESDKAVTPHQQIASSSPPPHTQALEAGGRLKRGRFVSSGELSPSLQDKKRGRVSGRHTSPDERTQRAPGSPVRTEEVADEEMAPPHDGQRAIGFVPRPSSSARTAPTMVRGVSTPSTPKVPVRISSKVAAAPTLPSASSGSALRLSRPPPLPTTSRSPLPQRHAATDPLCAERTLTGKAYWQSRQARAATPTPATPHTAVATNTGEAAQREKFVPSSDTRRAGYTAPRRASLDRAALSPPRARSIVLDESSTNAMVADDWRHSPVRWTPRLSGTLDTDMENMQRLLSARRDASSALRRSSEEEQAAARESAAAHRADRRSSERPQQTASQSPPPATTTADAPRHRRSTTAQADTPPPRFEEDRAQFQHAVRAWRQPHTPSDPLREASAPVTRRAALGPTRASVDSTMAYYTRLASGCRRTPISTTRSF